MSLKGRDIVSSGPLCASFCRVMIGRDFA